MYDLEKTYQKDSTKDKYRELVNMKIKYNIMNTYQAERAITTSRQQFFELGEKAHKVLAWQLNIEKKN